ncbi:triose-phosphate isomerase family protein [Humidisolicoccus flavus]|uniref:triose-phosphate isomerase family protein n=1 Tax=Humidisolicoccus flavus TaxID=3111414 RepID=UPI003250D47C
MPRFTIGTSTKMYFTHEKTRSWMHAVAEIVSRHTAARSGAVEFFAIPTFPSIPAALEIAAPAGVAIGAQDLASELHGAFTGEVSGAELAELGCSLVEVGHAERRAMFGETEEVVAKKVLAALQSGLTPLICVGEAREGDAHAAAAECVRLIESALSLARAAGVGGSVIIAYEPIWAIGAPAPAGTDHIRGVCRVLRSHLQADTLFEHARVIYGGSAGPGLLPKIAEDVDGMFLGRFAHDPEAVRAILDEAEQLIVSTP